MATAKKKPAAKKPAAKKQPTAKKPAAKAPAPKKSAAKAPAPRAPAKVAPGGPIDATIDTFSDAASLLIFDPDVCGDKGTNIREVAELSKAGKAAWFGLFGDMAYRVRVTDGDLTETEREFSKRPPVELGVEVASGRVYVSGNVTPGLPEEAYETGPGEFVAVPNGRYRVIAHFVQPPNRRTKAMRDLADFVVVLAPTKGPLSFAGPTIKNPFTGKMEEEWPPKLPPD